MSKRKDLLLLGSIFLPSNGKVFMAHCSPARTSAYDRDSTCFTKEQLVRLAIAWNETRPDKKIQTPMRLKKMALWQALNERMYAICGGSGREWCWADKLAARTPKPAEIEESLRPKKPKKWNTEPYTWLTNHDINAVMRQYNTAHSDYEFLGVYPIDFQARTAGIFGMCLFEEFCSLDIVRLYRRGIRYIGLITNLDRHNQSGSHWTSLFICIDPSKACFGAHYYDSIAREPPKEIVAFAQTVKEQIARISGASSRPFRLDYNVHQHQFKNSECGIFAMAYQIRWLTLLRDGKNPDMEMVTSLGLTDDLIHELRNVLYRPSMDLNGGGLHKACNPSKVRKT